MSSVVRLSVRVPTLAVLPLLMMLGSVSPASAIATYNYTGEVFDTATAPYTTSDFISGGFDLSVPLGANAPWQQITPTYYSFFDGVQELHSGNTTYDIFYVETDSTGNISLWSIEVSVDVNKGMKTYNREFGPVVGRMVDSTLYDGLSQSAEIRNNPGTWTFIPEPGTAALLGMGLAVLAHMRRRQRA